MHASAGVAVKDTFARLMQQVNSGPLDLSLLAREQAIQFATLNGN